MKTILLTGGLGYIGSHIAVELLNSSNEYFIIIIDNLTNSNIEKLSIIEQNKTTDNKNEVLFRELDLMDIHELDNLFQSFSIDLVIHLAGLKAVKESVNEPLLYYKTNLFSTIHLLEVMQKYDCKKIIFSSSATVYGSATPPYHESTLTGIGISNPYGKTKYMQEEIFRDLFVSDNNWNIMLLRYFNPVSQKNESLQESPNGMPNNLFPYLMQVYKRQLPFLQIFGNDYNTTDGTCVRDFIHVVDLALGHIAICEKVLNQQINGFNIYNLGTGHGVSVKELITVFEKVNNTTIYCKYVRRREGDLPVSYADSSLVKQEIGWETVYNLEEMVLL